MKPEDVGEIVLDETIFRKPSIVIYDKSVPKRVLQKWYPKPEYAHDMFNKIVDGWVKEMKKLESQNEKS